MNATFQSAILCFTALCVYPALPVKAQQPAQTPAPAPANPKPAQTDASSSREDGLSIELDGWLPHANPVLRGGVADTNDDPGNLNLAGHVDVSPGVTVSFPAGRGSRLQVSYFQVQGNAHPTATQDLALFNQPFAAGDALVAGYKLQNAKISWNYLTYPNPPNSKLRIKTLWEVQYTTMSSKIDAPADENATRATGTKSIIFPTFGLGVDYHATRNVRLEAHASGFALLHRADIYDAEASAVIRMGPIDAHIGAKVFHFKTSPKGDEYYAATVWGPYVGFEWGTR